MRLPPRCVIIAGPNGAGKATFAREFLPKDTDVVHFVNADLIAAGLSALKPEITAVTAGRVFLAEIDRLATAGSSYRPLANAWSVYDNSRAEPQLLEQGP